MKICDGDIDGYIDHGAPGLLRNGEDTGLRLTVRYCLYAHVEQEGKLLEIMMQEEILIC